ncbi:MAG: GNAT family N-acetyltransferase [Clostridia bacterium]|nr:GNAT family N-acetyltransferase [Clostridia bacterium]
MNLQIREICDGDFENASHVLWKSFYQSEKNNTPMEGMELFRDLTAPISLAMNTLDGKTVLYGAFCEGALLAVGAVKEKNHVLLLYVDPAFWGKRIGSSLLFHMESCCEGEQITLNASDGGVGFYERHGYIQCGERTLRDGLISTPMVKRLGRGLEDRQNER